MSYEFSEQYWTEYNNFLFLIKNIVEKNDYKKQFDSPSYLIETWKEIVESGYNYNFSVYDWQNDISIRNIIELILNDDNIKKLEYFYSNFKTQIESIDNELLKITFDFNNQNLLNENWWLNRDLINGYDN